MAKTDGSAALPSSTHDDTRPVAGDTGRIDANRTLAMHSPVSRNIGTLPDFSDAKRPDPLGMTVRLFAPVVVQPLHRERTSSEDSAQRRASEQSVMAFVESAAAARILFESDDLGATRAFAIEELLARHRQIQSEVAVSSSSSMPASSPSVSLSWLRQLERSFGLFLRRCWAPVSRAIAGLLRDWRRLSTVQQRVLGALALCLTIACLAVGFAQRPSLPMAAYASRIQPVRAVAASVAPAQWAAMRPLPPALLAPAYAKSTLERTAVDAFAEGRYVDAVRIYGALAQAHPEQPAFRDAERILSLRFKLQR